MTMFVFVALIVIAVVIAGASVAVALRQPPQEQVTMEEAELEPGWSVKPDHLRMW
jgi:hypothetical protein